MYQSVYCIPLEEERSADCKGAGAVVVQSASMAARWYICLLVLAAAGSCVLATTDRKPRFPGAPFDVNFDEDIGAQTALNYAINRYNMGSNDQFASKVSKVHSVTRQIVAGLKYVITADIARTTCTKSTFNSASCAFNEAADMSKPLLCKFEVQVIPWKNKNLLLKQDCQ